MTSLADFLNANRVAVASANAAARYKKYEDTVDGIDIKDLTVDLGTIGFKPTDNYDPNIFIEAFVKAVTDAGLDVKIGYMFAMLCFYNGASRAQDFEEASMKKMMGIVVKGERTPITDPKKRDAQITLGKIFDLGARLVMRVNDSKQASGHFYNLYNLHVSYFLMGPGADSIIADKKMIAVFIALVSRFNFGRRNKDGVPTLQLVYSALRKFNARMALKKADQIIPGVNASLTNSEAAMKTFLESNGLIGAFNNIVGSDNINRVLMYDPTKDSNSALVGSMPSISGKENLHA